jgi:multiple sugar transport system permease protein
MAQQLTSVDLAPVGRLTTPRRARRLSGGQILVYVGLSLAALVTLLPFVWMILAAFKPQSDIIALPPVWLSPNPTVENIVRVWTRINFARYFLNSVIATAAITAVILITSTFVGYVFAKFHFRGRDVLFIGVLAAMMIPWPITLLPRYQLIAWSGLLNTYGALIIPALYNAFGIFMMRQFMHGIPNELIDAARIDGAGEMRIFAQIVVPLSKPAIAALGIMEFMWSWDAFIGPLLVINSKNLFTLPVGLATFNDEFTTDYGALMAGAVIAVIPMFLVYVTLQRYFVAGIALTGQKG